MPRETALTPRMIAELAVIEAKRLYEQAADRLDDFRTAKRKAYELFSDAEANLVRVAKACDDADALHRSTLQKLQAATDEYKQLEAEETKQLP